MSRFEVKTIGSMEVSGESMFIRIDEAYRKGLQALEGFSHIDVLWWFSDNDNEAARNVVGGPQPYKRAPAVMGVFATRSPFRPNPIGLTVVQVLSIDVEAGIIEIPYIDAHPGTPILDIKPYTPSIDRVENPEVPEWCRHWPQNVETSGDFDWEQEFNF